MLHHEYVNVGLVEIDKFCVSCTEIYRADSDTLSLELWNAVVEPMAFPLQILKACPQIVQETLQKITMTEQPAVISRRCCYYHYGDF